MVLKQRFAAGRTQYIEIGDDFTIIQRNADEFDMQVKSLFDNREDSLTKEIHALICYKVREVKPLYYGFPQWIYTDDGKLFMNLTADIPRPLVK